MNQFGYHCPRCDRQGHIYIVASCAVRLWEGGFTPEGDYEWDEDSRADCSTCRWSGKVWQLKLVEGTRDETQ